MRYVTRRQILRSSLGIAGKVTLTVIIPCSAEAFDLGDAFEGIGAALVPAINLAQNVFQGTVATAASLAGSAVGAAAPNAGILGSLTNSFSAFMQAGLQQALPLFCNSNPSLLPINLFADMSGTPLPIGSSDEDELLGNPDAYMNSNGDILSGYLNKYGGGQNMVSLPFSLPAAFDTDDGTTPRYYPGNVQMQYQPPNPGYYPCGINYQNNQKQNQGFNAQSILSLISLAAEILPALG